MISRTVLPIVAVLCLGMTACSRHQPAAEPPASVQRVAETTTVNPPPAATTPAVSSTPTSVAPVAAASSRLRDLTANYLESDGHGGWRKSEKTATELDKLSSEDTAQLWPLLKDQDAKVRRAAAVFLLAQFDETNSQQVEAFTALLGDADAFVRARGLDAVRQFVAADKIAALPQVVALLDSHRENRAENRAAAARMLGGMKKDAASAGPALQAAANDPDAKVRSAALAALVQVADPSLYIAPLGAALADSDPSVRVVAAARLRQVGAAAAPVAPSLAAALADSNKDVAEAAAEALIRVGPPAVEPLADQLASSNVQARKLALAALARLGPSAKSAAARIEKCKQDSDKDVRQLAEIALKSLGSP